MFQEEEIFENLADLDLEKKVSIPYIIKNALLISPGTWNNFYYSVDIIHEAFRQTDWNDKKILSLFLDHLDDRTSEWVGYVKNPHEVNGKVLGDLEIYDINTAIKLALGKPKFGISPRVKGQAEEGIMKRFMFENFSFVINPAVKTTFINNMEVKGMDFKLQDEEEVEESEPTETEIEEVSEELKKKKEEKYPEKEMAKKKKEEEEMKKKKPEEEEMKKKPKEEDEEAASKEELSAYTDFVKKYIKSHKGEKKASELIKDAAEAWKKNHEAVELEEKQARFLEAVETILEYLKKYKYPKEGYGKYPYDKYPATKMEEKDKQIAELQEKVEKLEAKLNEPDKISVKTGEESSTLLTEYSDEAMLKYLERQRGVVEV